MRMRFNFWIWLPAILLGGACCLVSPWAPQLEQTRQEARWWESRDHLHDLSMAVLSYESRNGRLTPSAIFSPTEPAVPLHGWQTLLLRDLGHGGLMEKIDLSESWSADANRPHFQQRVDKFINLEAGPEFDAGGFALSHYSANSQVLVDGTPLKLSEVTDGAANTIVMGEISTNLPPWGQPRNVRNPADGLHTSPNSFGGPWENGVTQFGMLDGKVRAVNRDIDPKVLKALATPAGGEE